MLSSASGDNYRYVKLLLSCFAAVVIAMPAAQNERKNMGCFHPLRRFNIGVNPETGKSLGKVVSHDVEAIVLTVTDEWRYITAPVYRPNRHGEPVLVVGPYAKRVYTDYVDIPCGNCIGCRLDRSKQWAARLMCEVPYHTEAWFLTLTYNDLSLPTSYWQDEQGMYHEEHSLRKRDLQLFMKRLRKHFPSNSVSFFACGEYGFQTMRPHYHLILFFGSQDEPISLLDKSCNSFHKLVEGHAYYTNDLIGRLWHTEHSFEPAGFHYLTSVSYDTCAYVAKYCTKTLKGDLARAFADRGLEQVFSLMSRRPAIGRRFFDDHGSEIYAEDSLLLPGDTVKRVRPPKYYDTLFDVEHHEELCDYKSVKTKAFDAALQLKLQQTDLSYEQYLAVCEDNFKANASKSMSRKSKNRV